MLLALGVSLVSYSIVLNKKPSTPIVPDKPQDIEENPELSYAEKIAKSYTCTFYDDKYTITLEKDCTFVLKNKGIVLEKGSFTIQADGTLLLSLFGEEYVLKPDLINSLMLMIGNVSGDYTEYSNQVGALVYKLRLYNEGYARLFLEGSIFNVYGSYSVENEKCTVTFLNEKSVVALYKENGTNRFKDYSEYEKSFYLGDYECSFMNNATLTLYESSFKIHNGRTLFEGDSYDLAANELCLYIGGTKLIIDIDSNNGKKASLKDITEGDGETYSYYSKDYSENYYFTFYSSNGTYKMTSPSMGYTLYGYYKVFSQNRYYVMCLKNSGIVVIDDGKLYLASEYVEDTSEKFAFENNVNGESEYELSITNDGNFTLVRRTQYSSSTDEHKGTYTANPYGIVLSNDFYGIFKDKVIVLDYENHLFSLVKYYKYTDYNGKTYFLKQIAVDDDTDEFVLGSSVDSQEISKALIDKNTLKDGFRLLGNDEKLIWVSGDTFVYAESLLGKYYYGDDGEDYLILSKDLSYELSINGYLDRGVFSMIDGQMVLDGEIFVTLTSNRFSFTKDRITKVECTLPDTLVKGENVNLSDYSITVHTLLGNVYHSPLSEVSIEGLSTESEGEYECKIVFREYTHIHTYTIVVETPSYLNVINLPDTITLGEGINFANSVVNVISDLGRVMYSTVISEDMFIDLDLSSVGSKSATLTYMGLTYIYEYTVVSDVYDVEIVGLTISKNIFSVGEEIDLTDARIRIRTNLNTFRYEKITLDMLIGFSTEKAGSGVFTVEYNGMRYIGSSYTVKAIPQSYELTVDVVLSTVAGVESDIKYMTNAYFVALTDGTYRFESISRYGIRAYLYDEDMNLLAYDYAGSENSIDFVIEYSLKQGERVKLYYRVDSDQNEQIELIATKIE